LNKKQYLIRYSNIIPVKGHTKSILCDLQKNNYWEVDNFCYSFLETFNRTKIIDILESNSDSEESTIELIKNLVDNGIVFFSFNPEYFPNLNLQWDEPFHITNIIIDLSDCSIIRFLKESMYNIVTHTVQIRIFYDIVKLELDNLLNIVSNINARSVELLLPFGKITNGDYFKQLTTRYSNLSLVIIYNSPYKKQINYTKGVFGRIFYLKDSMTSHKSCGIIFKNSMVINFKLFTESIQYNSCLNRKVSVDDEGNIKNCPSMKESYGNIKDTTLAEAIEKPGFKRYWDINKDKIHDCNDCEFRYICTDCRAYMEDPDDILSKPLKCGYNPYTGEWSEWSTNPLKQKAIDFYGMREMVEEIGGGDS